VRAQPTFATLASGLKLHYRVQGNPEGPWLVLLNGLLSDTTMWAGVLPGLVDRFRVLTFDSRGQGRSDAPPEGPAPTVGDAGTRSPGAGGHRAPAPGHLAGCRTPRGRCHPSVGPWRP